MMTTIRVDVPLGGGGGGMLIVPPLPRRPAVWPMRHHLVERRNGGRAYVWGDSRPHRDGA